MAATLRCGFGAALSHTTAAMLWSLISYSPGVIHVSTSGQHARGRGITTHRRRCLQTTRHRGIPVTTPIQTLIDIAPLLDRDRLEAAINEADKRRLVDPDTLRQSLDRVPRAPGVGVLRATLDYRTFTLTDSHLERLFLPIARAAGLPKPLTRRRVNGFRVDFYWPDLRWSWRRMG